MDVASGNVNHHRVYFAGKCRLLKVEHFGKVLIELKQREESDLNNKTVKTIQQKETREKAMPFLGYMAETKKKISAKAVIISFKVKHGS